MSFEDVIIIATGVAVSIATDTTTVVVVIEGLRIGWQVDVRGYQ